MSARSGHAAMLPSSDPTDTHHQSWTGAASLAAGPGEQHRRVKTTQHGLNS